jgi:hypothetical protein
MGLRCLLGHDFGVPEVERERETDGNEVVVTVREVKTCRRCGERQIVSENKEVTTVERAVVAEAAGGSDGPDRADEPAGPGSGTETGDPAAPFGGGQEGPQPADAAVTDTDGDAEPDAGGVASGVGEGAGDPSGAAPSASASDPAPTDSSVSDDSGATVEEREAVVDADAHDAETDDGVILDDGPDEEERQHGEWPDATDVRGQDGTPSADADGPDHPQAPAADPTGSDAAGTAGPDGGPSPDATPGGEPPGTSADERTADADAAAEGPVTDDAELLDEDDGDDEFAWPTHNSPAASADGEGVGSRTNGTEPGAGTGTGGGAGTSGHGDATPGSDADGESDAVSWPAPSGEDEGFDAQPSSQTGEDADPDVSFGGGLAPREREDDRGADREYVGHERETADDAEFIRDDGPDAPAGEGPPEFYCPNCGHAATAGQTSMRAGDICPECRKGYVAERRA